MGQQALGEGKILQDKPGFSALQKRTCLIKLTALNPFLDPHLGEVNHNWLLHTCCLC